MDTKKIYINENITIENNRNIYKIHFKYPAYSIINSLLKTRIIPGGSTDNKYKTIVFNAYTVKTLKQYQSAQKKIQGKPSLSIPNAAKMLTSLVTQLNYLLEKESSTILGYTPNEIIVINDEKFAFLGSELVANLDPEGTNHAIISCPFSTDDFFISPELLKIREIPSFVHFKTAYFSLALLIIYCLLFNEDEEDLQFYTDYLIHKQSEKIINILNNHPIRYTRLFWLLSRCLVEDPDNRSIVLI